MSEKRTGRRASFSQRSGKDFRVLLIENNLVYMSAKKGGKGVFEDTPKTDASARVIDISDDASDLLRQLRIEQSRAYISPYVFSQDGRAEPMHPTSPTRYFAKSNPASGGQFMPTCGVLPMDFPVVLCYTERKDANAAETGRFSACTVSILQNGVSGWI